MKINRFFKIFMFFIVLLMLFGCSQKPYVDIHEDFNSTDMILSEFESNGDTADCPIYRELEIDSYVGYCIYYEKVSNNYVQSANDGGKSIIVNYVLQPASMQGSWFSIRKLSSIQYDLSQYSGIKLKIRTIKTADVTLRITLADIDPKTFPYATDELWMCDFQKFGENIRNDWGIVVCPISSFVLNTGEGARQNNQKLDLQNIVAFEISMISRTSSMTNGSIEIGELAAYK